VVNKPVRVAIYLRFSKDDGSQQTDNQILQIREFCERWEGHQLVAEYVDREFGTRGRRERHEFDRMFADAARRRFDGLLFWARDRFGREGIRKTIAYLERLDACGEAFKSYTEPFLLGRPDGFERWAPVLSKTREREFSQGRMSWETGLSYNTVKKYLKRLEEIG
jgi:DNA invertase Pin-like site-specific DNA recombinase